MQSHGTSISEVSRNLAKAFPAPPSPWVYVYIIVPIITDTSMNLLLLYLQHSVCVWGIINTAGETKSSRFLLVVLEEIYVKQFG